MYKVLVCGLTHNPGGLERVVYNFFKETRKVLRKELKISTRISMLVADKMNMTKILHIKL